MSKQGCPTWEELGKTLQTACKSLSEGLTSFADVVKRLKEQEGFVKCLHEDAKKRRAQAMIDDEIGYDRRLFDSMLNSVSRRFQEGKVVISPCHADFGGYKCVSVVDGVIKLVPYDKKPETKPDKYNPKAKCVKCGCKKIRDVYYSGMDTLNISPAIERVCTNCGHTWIQAPLNSTAKEKEDTKITLKFSGHGSGNVHPDTIKYIMKCANITKIITYDDEEYMVDQSFSDFLAVIKQCDSE